MKKPRYSSIFIRGIVLLLCLLANISLIFAAIDVQPREATICQGGAVGATFTLESQYLINTVGAERYGYQWCEWDGSKWEPIRGSDARGDSYSPSVTGTFSCLVRDNITGVEEYSVSVTLTVNDVPRIRGILVPPVCDSSNLVASVPQDLPIITGGSDLIEYKWILGGIEVDNGTPVDNVVPSLTYYVTNDQHVNSQLILTVTNACGSSSVSEYPYIQDPLQPPTPVPWEYCEGTNPVPPMAITEENIHTPVWYNSATDETEIPTPTPGILPPGTYTWWVLQKYTIPDGPTCVSKRSRADAVVRGLPDVPSFGKSIVEKCLNDPDTTLVAYTTGPDVTLQWYNQQNNPIAVAPQINTTNAGEQIYYVTQTDGKCESSRAAGKITVRIKARAKEEDLELTPSQLELCPNNSTVIVASAKVTGSTFRWYKNSDKTGWFQDGSTLATPVLTRDTAYYVTIQYGDFCESGYSKSSYITVRDITFPRITAPPSLVVSTDPGVCYASNVQTGSPIVSDNCTIYDSNNLATLVYTDPTAPAIYLLGDTTLIWWVQDEAIPFNRSYDLQAITVRDREKPMPRIPGGCPAVVDKVIDDSEYSAIIHYNLDYLDNCDGTAVIDSLNTGLPSGSEFPLGETRIRYFIMDKAGNVDTCEFKVIVRHPYRPLEVILYPSKRIICPGEELVITPRVSGGSGKYNYMWMTPRPWTDAVMKDYPLVNTVYEVTVDDGIDPPQTKSVAVTVLEINQVELMLEGRPMDQIFEGDEVQVTATDGFSSYKLLLNNEVIQEIGLNNQVTFQAELGKYQIRVFATDLNFCVTQDQLDIDIESRKLPNVFTPNFDGINDKFLEGFDLEVFSRSGLLIYKGNEGWDGTYKGKPVPQGTYLYVVRRIMNNGELRIFKNNVTLKR